MRRLVRQFGTYTFLIFPSTLSIPQPLGVYKWRGSSPSSTFFCSTYRNISSLVARSSSFRHFLIIKISHSRKAWTCSLSPSAYSPFGLRLSTPWCPTNLRRMIFAKRGSFSCGMRSSRVSEATQVRRL
ncbi:hypothetical protein BDN71DRAFT_1295456 [Pleurotus eryngii]|uniref:Uncharacterized protein n=1 Tax=Pleurotus eryngii TaxID=5323 RepID=A0A9P5ZP58_PLEER|nr:hypothetical protein BDN71DRAFT_1295456 [Pleurotus eryngii]